MNKISSIEELGVLYSSSGAVGIQLLGPVYAGRRAACSTKRSPSRASGGVPRILIECEERSAIIKVKKEILLFFEGSFTTAFVLATLSASCL